MIVHGTCNRQSGERRTAQGNKHGAESIGLVTLGDRFLEYMSDLTLAFC
jgi:hypothetical protein